MPLTRKPRAGDRVRLPATKFRPSGEATVTEIDESICWIRLDGGLLTCFIWHFADGSLNEYIEEAAP